MTPTPSNAHLNTSAYERTHPEINEQSIEILPRTSLTFPPIETRENPPEKDARVCSLQSTLAPSSGGYFSSCPMG